MQRTPLIPVLTGTAVADGRLPGFTVTLVEHPPLLRLAAHRHEQAIFAVLLRGRYDETLGRRAVSPHRMSLLVKPPGTDHANEIGREGTLTVLMQVDSAAVDMQPDHAGMFVHDDVLRLSERIVRELSQPDGSTLALESLVLELTASDVTRQAAHGCTDAKHWLRTVRDYLNDTPFEEIRIGAAASIVGADRAHTARAFRRAFGCSMGEYVRMRRLDRVAHALRSGDVAIATIAMENGFFDQSHLHRFFVRAYGITPAEYRRLAPPACNTRTRQAPQL